MQREIHAWLQSSGFTSPVRRATKDAESIITTDAEVDALMKSVIACTVSVRDQAEVHAAPTSKCNTTAAIDRDPLGL